MQVENHGKSTWFAEDNGPRAHAHSFSDVYFSVLTMAPLLFLS